ncbi:NAD-dependent epimerase/dehydratase family protein [Salipiger mucosus]|uniref:Putative sugar nucleotide epimerase/dehydratase n=1 Tax=Salipiger mucosus DSM 16094 TaxID=1123237 RepID=S9RWL1_9RHOB|nr:NAD-dependent epimerase/dehydratase family protein [Salipiger mucosus]EPX82420.1 putative sugar nucleotide epimerase/dehydratase [Salipiger mucosus DSM 16094]
MTQPRAFITGGAGFIGSRLAARLVDQGAEVTVFDSFLPQVHAGNPGNRARLEACGARIVEGDIRDRAAVDNALREAAPDIVYHLAAETGTGQSFDLPARYSEVNVMGTAHLIEAVRSHGPQVRRIVLAGTRAVYGEGAHVDAEGRLVTASARDDDAMASGDFEVRDARGTVLTPVATNADCSVAPASIYASSKLMQEYLLQQAFWGTGVAVGVLRLQNVFGPGQSLNNPYTGVLSIFCRQIQEGATLAIFEDGEITRDFVLVDDVVRAFAMMGSAAEMPGEILDIGSGQTATIRDIAGRLLELFGASRDRLRVTGAFRPGDVRHALADISRARDRLGWTPEVTLDEGLARLVEWSRTTAGTEAEAATARVGA